MRSRDSLIRINDCKITANSTGRCMGVALAGQGNDLSIQNSTITAEKYHPVRAMGVDTTMNIAGSTISGYCAISTYVGQVDLTVTNSTLNGRNTNDIYDYGVIAYEVGSWGNITVTDCVINSVNNGVGTGKLHGLNLVSSNTTLKMSGTDVLIDVPYGNDAYGVYANPAGLVIDVSGNYWGENLANLDLVVVEHLGRSALSTHLGVTSYSFYLDRAHTKLAIWENGRIVRILDMTPKEAPRTPEAEALPSLPDTATKTKTVSSLQPIVVGYEASIPTINGISGQVLGKGRAKLQVDAQLPGNRMLYQWQRQQEDGSFQNIGGANGSVYTAKGLTPGKEYRFRCLVSGYGGGRAVSDVVNLRAE